MQTGRIVAVVSAVLVLSGCGGSSDNESTANSPSRPSSETVSIHLTSVPSSSDALALEKLVTARIAKARVGEYDKTSWNAANGGGQAEMAAYGPDADALWKAIEPVIQRTHPKPGSYATKIYGDATDPSARQVRVDLAP